MRLWLSPRSRLQARRTSPPRSQTERRDRPLPTAGRAFPKCQQTVVSPRPSELQRTRRPVRRCVPASIPKPASRSARQNRQLPRRSRGDAKVVFGAENLLADLRRRAGLPTPGLRERRFDGQAEWVEAHSAHPNSSECRSCHRSISQGSWPRRKMALVKRQAVSQFAA
jgi:hypothetical protein